ncbi:Mediator of RNA polymerase II transcription subunit 26 [Armadillidium nasatum]|uniref:Mediator of RNA polymerase II transcription subunit 26 n=1 Tax=Armadillidium nasatum TaxID=96803 RepID=A0A5N5T9N1_9CRUS|nr:Mediator of RNA polymerase II transcription subunit 26 [Armadillidium nasatum]
MSLFLLLSSFLRIIKDTRLGKYVNDIRRKTKDQELPKRLKNLVRKWRDACQAESLNGFVTRGPGPGGGSGGGGGSSSNGRQSISPPYSTISSFKGHGGGLSPCSLPSSGNTSPLGRVSAPTTPSTISFNRSRTVSPVMTIAKPPLSLISMQDKSKVLSPRLVMRSPAISPQFLSSNAKPQSPSFSKTTLSSNYKRNAQESKIEATYLPSVDNVPKTNAANKRLRKPNEDSDSELPPSKRSRNNLSNGFEQDECSRDSFCSIVSNDRISRTSVDGGGSASIISVSENSLPQPPQKSIRRSGRKKKNTQDLNSVSNLNTEVDPLRQKMAVINATKCLKKVKTTSEIVAELAQRKGDAVLARRASRLEERVKDRKDGEQHSPLSRSDYDTVSQNKKEHMEKFLKSQPDPHVEDDDDEITILDDDDAETEPTSTVPPSPFNPTPIEILPFVPQSRPNSPPSNLDLLGIKPNESAEEILSRLPPIDVNAIEWSSSPEQIESQPKDSGIMSSSDSESEESDVDDIRRLSRKADKVDPKIVHKLRTTNVEHQNGNFDMNGRFREWHEVYLQKSYQDAPLFSSSGFVFLNLKKY